MDFLRLDENYVPDLLIEKGTPQNPGYSSLIWTERFLSLGEFELRTPLILETMQWLPEESLVSHRETNEVMMVETHQITVNAEGFLELVVKGRSVEAILEMRALEGPYPKKKYKMSKQYAPHEAAAILIWNALVHTGAEDVTRAGPGTRDPKDAIPGTIVTFGVTNPPAPKRRWLTGGQVYPQLIALLRQGQLGIRTMRPPSNPVNLVSVSKDDKGIITLTNPSTTTSLRFHIYNGVNRSKKQSVEDAVVLHYASDYLKDESYLYSNLNHVTEALVVSGVGTRKLYRDKRADAPKTGWSRRVKWVDAGEPDLKEIPDRPDDDASADAKAAWRQKRDEIKAENEVTRAEFMEDLRDKADEELEKGDLVRLFDCKIDTTSPYKYREHYFLGDKVSLIGRYDFDETMWVVEHVRTEDVNGDVGYPTLAADLDDDAT